MPFSPSCVKQKIEILGNNFAVQVKYEVDELSMLKFLSCGNDAIQGSARDASKPRTPQLTSGPSAPKFATGSMARLGPRVCKCFGSTPSGGSATAPLRRRVPSAGNYRLRKAITTCVCHALCETRPLPASRIDRWQIQERKSPAGETHGAARSGGELGIRTPDTLRGYTRLAGEHLRPLGQLSGKGA